jgi:hypothetical protein
MKNLRAFMRPARRLLLGFGCVAASGFVTRPAAAQGVPSWFVPEDMCGLHDCMCSDIPMMQSFLDNQKNAQAAWQSIRSDILAGTGPRSDTAAKALFKQRFPGDPDVVAQFESCQNYDPNKNSVDKVAGVSPLGAPMLDPCFCDAFCSDIVESTIAHERMHVPTIILGALSKGDYMIACGLGVASGYLCDIVLPLILTDSEILSYDAGISALDASLTKLKEYDPSNPSMACTWECIAPPPTPAQDKAVPQGFWQRVSLLFERVLHGSSAP